MLRSGGYLEKQTRLEILVQALYSGGNDQNVNNASNPLRDRKDSEFSAGALRAQAITRAGGDDRMVASYIMRGA